MSRERLEFRFVFTWYWTDTRNFYFLFLISFPPSSWESRENRKVFLSSLHLNSITTSEKTFLFILQTYDAPWNNKKSFMLETWALRSKQIIRLSQLIRCQYNYTIIKLQGCYRIIVRSYWLLFDWIWCEKMMNEREILANFWRQCWDMFGSSRARSFRLRLFGKVSERKYFVAFCFRNTLILIQLTQDWPE